MYSTVFVASSEPRRGLRWTQILCKRLVKKMSVAGLRHAQICPRSRMDGPQSQPVGELAFNVFAAVQAGHRLA